MTLKIEKESENMKDNVSKIHTEDRKSKTMCKYRKNVTQESTELGEKQIILEKAANYYVNHVSFVEMKNHKPTIQTTDLQHSLLGFALNIIAKSTGNK